MFSGNYVVQSPPNIHDWNIDWRENYIMPWHLSHKYNLVVNSKFESCPVIVNVSLIFVVSVSVGAP